MRFSHRLLLCTWAAVTASAWRVAGLPKQSKPYTQLSVVDETQPHHWHHWFHEQRNIAADFRRLFGDESSDLPALIGVAIGADADNTHGHSLGDVSGLQFE